MLTAESETTFPSVSVIKDISETLSPAATDQPQHHQDQKLLILADQVPVESMLNVEKEIEQLPVLVFPDSLAIPMSSVNQSAQSTKSVRWSKLV